MGNARKFCYPAAAISTLFFLAYGLFFLHNFAIYNSLVRKEKVTVRSWSIAARTPYLFELRLLVAFPTANEEEREIIFPQLYPNEFAAEIAAKSWMGTQVTVWSSASSAGALAWEKRFPYKYFFYALGSFCCALYFFFLGKKHC
ncbi:MAG: hypothetical protein AAGF04_02005 [Chlamydiota bacterium]